MQTGKEPEVEIRDSLVHGVVGGLLAGALVAVWFLVVDLSAGEPLRTPSALGSALFGAQDATRLGGPVALYTVLHFATFAALGLATALFLRSTGLTPGWMLGVVFGIVVLNGVHYVGLLVADQALLGVLPWPHVVGANLAAGVGLMTYLHRTAGASGPLGPETLRYHPILLEGLEVGLLGATTVAAWFLLVDIVSGAPLRTPAALASALFLGAEGPGDVQRSGALIAGYSLVHGLAFWVAGVVLVSVARQLERLPSLAYLVVLAFILLEAVSLGVLVAFGAWVLGTVSVWAIGIGNLLAVLGMAAWIWRSHPRLRERVRREGFASTA